MFNSLRTIDLVNGTSAFVADIAGWVGTIAIPGALPIIANFNVDNDSICIGGNVNITDNSTNAISWEWTFEGGTPSTSPSQNPSVVYNATGVFDITLVVSDGTNNDTLFMSDFITVEDIPITPTSPTGPIDICGNEMITYTTNSVSMSHYYVWEVIPTDAGTITWTDTVATFESSVGWSGTYDIKVKAANDCGSSSWSNILSCNLNYTSNLYFISGGEGYCEGGQGLDILLGGSDVGVDYELFLDGVSTNTVISGTGNPISFGYQNEEGIYTSVGNSGPCSISMFGDTYVYILPVPEIAMQPVGEELVCQNDTTSYQTNPILNSDTIVWILIPSDAGSIIGSGEDVLIHWHNSFAGIASLSVYGSNDCGDGEQSDELEIEVSGMPAPEALGENEVCKGLEYTYSTSLNSGSTYNWTIAGGEITSTDSTINEITIQWLNLGEGYVFVTEINSAFCEGASDTLNVLVDECTEIQEIDALIISVYPNPAKDILNMKLNSSEIEIEYIRIVNQFGQIVLQNNSPRSLNDNSIYVNTSNLVNGFYFVIIRTSNGTYFHARFSILN